MREIKFRAWIEPKGADFRAMANVSSIDFETRKIVVTFNNPYFAQTKFEFGDGDYTLMQSTELKDKNGKEIYDGDIFRDNDTFIWQVYNEDGMFMARGGEYGLSEILIEFVTEHCEIIGNIYENPELLEVKQ